MHFHHLTEDSDGVSHFSDGDIAMALDDFAPPAPPMYVSGRLTVSGLVHVTLPHGWVGKQHPSPARQVAYVLSGRMQVEAGDGEKRELRPGDIWHMEDTAGAGHVSAVVGPENVHLAVVIL